MNGDTGAPLRRRLMTLAAALAALAVLLSGFFAYGVTQLVALHQRIEALDARIAATHRDLDEIGAFLRSDAEAIDALVERQHALDDGLTGVSATLATFPEHLAPGREPPAPWGLSGAIGTTEQFRARGH